MCLVMAKSCFNKNTDLEAERRQQKLLIVSSVARDNSDNCAVDNVVV